MVPHTEDISDKTISTYVCNHRTYEPYCSLGTVHAANLLKNELHYFDYNLKSSFDIMWTVNPDIFAFEEPTRSTFFLTLFQ